MTYVYKGTEHKSRKALIMWIQTHQGKRAISCQSVRDGRARAARLYGDFKQLDTQTQEEWANECGV